MMAFNNPYSPFVTQVSLPFSSPIPGGLFNGKQIQIQGIVQKSPVDGFSINLCETAKIEPNCALHFNVRFNEGCIVRNDMKGGSWGHEERDNGLPIMKGQLFEIIILCAPDAYHIAVNGRHFTEFKHRLPMTMAKYLLIHGNSMEINFIKYEGGEMGAAPPAGFTPPPGAGIPPGMTPPPYTPGGFMVPPGMESQAGMPYKGQPDDGTLYNPPVPLTQPIPGQLYPNRMIYISGIPYPGAKRFTINLQNGTSGNANINFHFDVRLAYLGEHNVVVRNTFVGGKWGKEERSAGCFPFAPNASFDIVIMADSSAFKVAVNNSHFISYDHRQPLNKSNTLNIQGDVKITTVRFQ